MEEYICQPVPIFYYDALNTQARSCYMLIKILNIVIDVQEVNFVHYGHISEHCRGMNTFHSAPTLIDGNITLCHGQTIMMYLCEKYSNGTTKALFPRDYVSRIKIMSIFYYEGYYLHRYLGHLLTDIFLCTYCNFDKDYHCCKVLKAYKTLNNFLNSHSYMIGDCMTIADISTISAVATLNIVFPIDNNQFPNLFEWFNRLKKMEFYQYNDEGIYKQRYFLCMLGKFAFPTTSFDSECRQADKPKWCFLDETDKCVIKDQVIDLTSDVNLYMNNAFERSSAFSEELQTDQLQPLNFECKTLSNESDLENVGKNDHRKSNSDAKTDCYHCSYYTSTSNTKIHCMGKVTKSGKHERTENCIRQNGSNKAINCDKKPDFGYTFYPGSCNAHKTTQVCKKANCTYCPRRTSLECRKISQSQQGCNKNNSCVECIDIRRRGMDHRKCNRVVCHCSSCSKSNAAPYANNTRNNTVGKEKDISEKVIHIVVEKLKEQKNNGHKTCDRNCTASCVGNANTDHSHKTECRENMEKLNYCSCAETPLSDGACSCLGSTENQQNDKHPHTCQLSRKSNDNGNLTTTSEIKSFPENFKACNCFGEKIPDQTHRCSCALKSKRENDQYVAPQIRKQAGSIENSSLAQENDLKSTSTLNENASANCQCKRIFMDTNNSTVNCKQLQINCCSCRLNPENINLKPNYEEAIERDSQRRTAILTIPKDSEATDDNQTSEATDDNHAFVTVEEDVVVNENTEDNDAAAGKTKMNSIVECNACTFPKLVNNLLLLNPEKRNQNGITDTPSTSDLGKEHEFLSPRNSSLNSESKKQSSTKGRLQAGCNSQTKSKAKFQNTLYHSKSYCTLMDESLEVTKLIYHIFMTKDFQCQGKCADCINAKHQNTRTYKSKIPRLVSNYQNVVKLPKDVECNFCHTKHICNGYF